MEMEAAIITAFGMLAIGLVERIFDNKRFSKQLEREREVEVRDRHRRVRDEPLLRLRAELARMATKNQRLINNTQMLHTAIPAPPEEELNECIEQAIKDLNDYIERGEFYQVLFTIDNNEIVEKADKLEKDYRLAFLRNTTFSKIADDEMSKVSTQNKELANQVREIQALINQQLEQL